MRASKLFATVLSIALAGAITAQDIRYELGLRVRAFETAFEARCDDVETRARVCPSLERAVQSFFGIRIDEVARNMDEARRLLDGDQSVPPAVQWADSLSLRLRSRLVDPKAAEVNFELRSAYEVDADVPEDTVLHLQLVDLDGKPLQDAATFELTEVPLRDALPLALATAGDHRLLVEVRCGEDVLARHEQVLSCASDLAARLEAIGALAKTKPNDSASATARGLARLLGKMGRGATRETDVRAVRHLDQLERLAAGASPFSIDQPGDFRIWLRTPRATVASRVLVPPKPASNPLPVVVALHGAGGSENLFFDGYGAGKIVRLCRERGWLLVAPRSGIGGNAPVDAIVDALAELFPVDRQRIFAVGHSMGAAQLMAHASRQPASLCAIALLGGGGTARASAELEALPILVAPGEKDFALGGARRLRDRLQRADVEILDYREYEATEHLGIVQVALDDVFAFFDRFAEAR